MRVLKKILLWVLLVAALTMAIIGGVVWWMYSRTDATAFTVPRVAVGGEALSVNGYRWSAPVMGGLLYRDAQENATAQWQDLGVVETPSLAAELPADSPAHLVVKDESGLVVCDVNNEAKFTIDFPANGSYTVEANVTVPEADYGAKRGTGIFRYAARVTVRVPPKVEFSSLRVEQGAVVAVKVTGFLDGAEPQIETELSLTQFCDVPGGKEAFIGIHHNREPGEYPIRVTCGETDITETLTVVHRDFPRQEMWIDASIANATMNSAAANEEWKNVMFPLYEAADPVIYWSGTFVRPCETKAKNTEYGLFRYTNGSTTPERHAGIDYDCNLGDEVWSPARGRVLYAGFLQMTGNTVVVEHGGGLKSYFFHMDSLACEAGQMVEQHQVVGYVGSTGYSTGPHLHYEARIGNQSVDPEQLFDGSSGLYF